jgi:hypothetical protein
MGVEAQQIKYAMKKAHALAKRYGIAPEDLWSSNRGFSGGKPRSTYRMAAEIRAALSKLK